MPCLDLYTLLLEPALNRRNVLPHAGGGQSGRGFFQLENELNQIFGHQSSVILPHR